MIKNTMVQIILDMIIKEFNISTENKEHLKIAKELAENTEVYKQKIQEKNRSTEELERKKLFSEASLLYHRCFGLREQLKNLSLVSMEGKRMAR